ncbi:MAG: hypothetical protein ACYDH0_05550 [Candidatus Aminicenantales bacterium]
MNIPRPAKVLFWIPALVCLSFQAAHLSAAVTYDFVQRAGEAKWYSLGPPRAELPWNGSANDNRGFVRPCAGVTLEDGKVYALVLETHPEWKKGGAIYGVYSDVLIPAGAKFAATVGFLKDATATDGVVFAVYVRDQATTTTQRIADKSVRYDGALDDLSADLGAFSGKTVTITLRVSAGVTSTQDWAVWASAAVIQGAALKTPRAGDMAGIRKSRLPGPARIPARPAVINRIPLRPIGMAPSKHRIVEVEPLPIEEPLTLSKRIYQDQEKPNTYYYLPREIDLVRDEATGKYRVSAVWTQDKKIRTTLVIQANIDPDDVRVLEEAVKAAKGPSAVLKSIPYDEADIIDMKGWEDWQIEDIRIPTFGSLEAELPISIAMTPETLAQLKPLLEKEGLTAGMRIKTGEDEMPIPIKVGLKYFTGRMYSPLEEIGFSYDERASLLTLHHVRNLSDFPLKIANVSLRFRLPGGEEVYKSLTCQAEVIIPPGESRDIQAQLTLRGLLLAEYRKVFPAPPPPPKKNPIVGAAVQLIKKELDKNRDKDKDAGVTEPAEKSVPADPRLDAFFRNYARGFWMEAAPDFDCQACLDKIWGSIEVVSYIERMREVNVEALANVFDPSAYATPLEVEKVHVEIRSPYLSAQARDGLMAAVDLNKDKLKDLVPVYLPLATAEKFAFEYKLKVVLKTGESAESPEWEKVVDSLDLTFGILHVTKIFQKQPGMTGGTL